MEESHRIRNVSCKRQGKLANGNMSEITGAQGPVEKKRLGGSWQDRLGCDPPQPWVDTAFRSEKSRRTCRPFFRQASDLPD
jgi:hypothetical protein